MAIYSYNCPIKRKLIRPISRNIHFGLTNLATSGTQLVPLRNSFSYIMPAMLNLPDDYALTGNHVLRPVVHKGG
jgi:hypothetical protein